LDYSNVVQTAFSCFPYNLNYGGLAYEKLGQKDLACTDFKSSVDLGYLKAQEEAKNVCP
jgi:hypothetical protein